MKRILPLLVVLVLLLCLCGCSTLFCKHDFEEATCQTPKTCTICGKTDGDIGDHSYSAATCKTPKTCTICGKTDGNIAAHTYADATCTAPKTCTVCQATDGKALGHTFADATCAAPKTCSVCGATEGEALSHTFTDATCTAPKTCSGCGTTEGEALGHTFTDATCTDPKTCSVCNATEGEALGHSFVDATCTTPKTCSVCNTTEGAALGHKYESGTCTVCGGKQPNYYAFTDGRWVLAGVTAGSNEEHEELDIIYLVPNNDEGSHVTVSFLENFALLDQEYQDWYMTEGGAKFYEFNGQKYSYMGFGTGADLSFTVDGDTVLVEITQGETGTLVLQRVSGNQFRVVSKNGIIVDEIVDTVVKVGSIFTYDG